MQQWLEIIAETMTDTVVDVLPIVLIMGFFQVVILRERIPNLGRVITGSICVVLGLGLFLVGLEQALFPLGKEMARQLSDPSIIVSYARIDTAQPLVELRKYLSRQSGQPVLSVFEYLREPLAHRRHTLGHDHTVFRQQPSEVVDQRGAFTDQ